MVLACRKKWKTLSTMIIITLSLQPLKLLASGQLVGNVIDARTKQSLPGANIQVLGTIQGTSTDHNGNFIIERIPPGTYSIRASMIGYRSFTREKVSETLELVYLEKLPIKG